MNEPAQGPPRFTLMQLMVAVAVISVLLGIGARLIPRWREDGRRAQCRNNLHQLALGVHLYHDVDNELPPLATAADGWTWQCLTGPFIEGKGMWSRLDWAKPARSGVNLPVVQQNGRSTLYLCPTRRSEGSRESGTYAGGQPMDYVAVSTSNSTSWDPQGDGMIVYRASVTIRPDGSARFNSATTFKSVTDGLGNTLMIGEKHMRPSWLGGQYDEPALVAVEGPSTIRVATDALGGKPLAQRREDDDPWKFGSWHNGVTLFAVGDASVRPISSGTDPGILRLLSCRHDGETARLNFAGQRLIIP